MTATANIIAAPEDVTLTRRGRFFLLGLPAMLLAAALLAAAIFGAASLVNQAQAGSAPHPGVEAVEVTVGEGETLWSIAAATESQTDIQQLITQIAEINGLESSQLQPGQVLHVPLD